MPTEEELRSGYKLGDWEVLPEQGVLRRGDDEHSPEPLTWRVLTSLATRNGGLAEREDLVQECWDGRPVTEDVINRQIAQVRRALDDDARNPVYVKTLQRRGYHLLKPVELLHPDESGPELESEPHPPKPPGLKRWKAAAAILGVFFLVSIFFDDIVEWFSPPPPPPPSIGVFPFQNESRGDLDEYVVSSFKMRVIASLAAMENLTVKNFRGENPEIGVDMDLEASLRLVGDQLSARYLIFDSSGELLFEGTLSGPENETFDLQERMAREITAKLGGQSQQQISQTRPENAQAYDSYMRAVYELENRGERENLNDAIGLFQRAIDLDKDYGPSYLGLATAYALMVDYFDAPIGEYNQLALDTIDAGVTADPTIENAAGSIYGFIFHKEKRWQEAEEAHQRAVNAELVDVNAFNWYSRMLASVGRLDDAVVQAERGVEMDPSWGVINSRLAMAYTWVENNEAGNEYFMRSDDLGAGGVNHEMGYGVLLIRTDRVNEARERTRAGLQAIGAPQGWVDPVFDAMLDETKVPAAISALDQFDTDGQIPPQASLIARGIFGDVEGAMRVARSLELPGEVFEIELLFVPEMAPLRQHPDFMPLLERLGIVEYWQQNDCTYDNDKVTCN